MDKIVKVAALIIVIPVIIKVVEVVSVIGIVTADSIGNKIQERKIRKGEQVE